MVLEHDQSLNHASLNHDLSGSLRAFAPAGGRSMQSAARFMGHPIHPMLIPYPFAFLSGATAFDVVAAGRGDGSLASTAGHLRNAGIVAALGAAVPGMIDYLMTVPDGRPKETATKHMLSNVTALGCFALAAWAGSRRDDNAPPGAATLALEVVGTALLAVGGWLGGTLAYHHMVGVTPEAGEAREVREGREGREVTGNVGEIPSLP
jgi:uncharacterized membrane protein